MSQPNFRPPLILLSGLGVDGRLLGPQQGIDAEVEVLHWIDPLPEEGIAEYGKRMSQRVAERVDPSRPFYLGGVSLGGMVAQEIAKHVRPSGLVLIASCRSAAALPGLYRFGASLAWGSPLWLIRAAKLLAPIVRPAFGIKTSTQFQMFQEMLADADPRFIRWSLRRLPAWQGTGDLGLPMLQIHGADDYVIPPKRSGAGHVIPGAGHVVNVTHANEVNAIISTWLAEDRAQCRVS